MDAFLTSVGNFLIQQGGFAVLSGVEGVVIWRLFNLLIESYKERIVERQKSDEAAYKAMMERSVELERFTSILRGQQGGK